MPEIAGRYYIKAIGKDDVIQLIVPKGCNPLTEFQAYLKKNNKIEKLFLLKAIAMGELQVETNALVRDLEAENAHTP